MTKENPSPLEAETGADEKATQTIECLDREWTLPAKIRLSDHRRFEAILARQHVRNLDVAFCDAFLTPEDVEALDDLDPDEEQLDELGTKISQALGFGSRGNS